MASCKGNCNQDEEVCQSTWQQR